MEKQFNIFLPFQKDIDGTISGIASTIAVDRDTERMSDNALRDMQVEIMSKGCPLFGNHEHSWENTLGWINQADIEDHKLKIKGLLDDPETNPKIEMLNKKLERGIQLGFSVGGAVTKEKEEYDRELEKNIKVIDGVKLFEISVVGIPSNPEGMVSLPAMISKSIKEISEMVKCPVCFTKMKKDGTCGLCFYKSKLKI